MQHEANVARKMSNTNTYEFYEIPGKMLTVEHYVRHREIVAMKLDDLEEFVKNVLCEQLVREMKKQKLIEFTRQENIPQDCVQYRARIFVTPDSQVRILRQFNK